MKDVRTAKLVNWCLRMGDHYFNVGDLIQANLIGAWLDELTDAHRYYRIKVWADRNPFPRFRLFRWLP